MKNQTVEKIIIGIISVAVVVLVAYLIISPKETVAPTKEGASVSNNINKMNELKIEVLKEGQGVASKNGDILKVTYKGMLQNGTVFDASANHGDGTFSFTLGAGQVIQGWDQGMLNMKVGEKRKLTIPATLAYGNRDLGIIPPNSTLIFEVELLKIN